MLTYVMQLTEEKMENPRKYNVAFIHKQKQMLEIVSSDITVILDISKLYGIDVLANSTQNGIHLLAVTLAKRSPPCMSCIATTFRLNLYTLYIYVAVGTCLISAAGIIRIYKLRLTFIL